MISEKQNDIKLTDEAVDLILHSPSDEHYKEAIKKIALKPSIYEKIFNEYGGQIPSDAALRIKLIRDYEFNPDSVDDFLNSFRKTIAFAGLTESQEIMNERNKTKEINGEGKMSLPSLQAKGIGVQIKKQSIPFPVPLSKGKMAIINFDSLPVEKKDIEIIKKWLDLFSDSLTEIRTEET